MAIVQMGHFQLDTPLQMDLVIQIGRQLIKIKTSYIISANNADIVLLFNSFKQQRLNYYEKLADSKDKLKTFLNGWQNRTNSFLDKSYDQYEQVPDFYFFTIK